MTSTRAIIALAATAALSACAPPQAGGPALLTRAVDAYVAGERSELAKVDAEASAQLKDAIETPGLTDACTYRAAAARRSVIEAVMIQGLDQPTVMSMSETARYLNFRSVASGQGGGRAVPAVPIEALAGPDCGRDHPMLALSDNLARMELVKTMIVREQKWRADLERRYPGQMTPRLTQAAKLLERYGYSVDLQRAIQTPAI